MNARHMIAKLDGYGGFIPFNSEELEVTLRALRLLAAAESNDGTTPETDAAAERGSDHGLGNAMMSGIWPLARRLERERAGLAARVVELEKDAERIAWIQMVAAMAESENQDEVNEADEVGNQLREKFIVNGHNLRAAIDAARSKQ